MKNKITYAIKNLLVMVLLVLGLASCKDFLDVKPEEVLLPESHFRNKYDADAAVLGIYGKFIKLAPQYVILNELRADLMDVTPNADNYLRQINQHKVVAGNPYTDPQPFYSVINDCNDALKNFKIMLDGLKLKQDEYNQRYSDIVSLRSWIYLQLVIQYGKVPYITEPIESIDDVSKINNNQFPILGIKEMVPKLLEVMSTLPFMVRYTEPTLFTTIDGYSTRIVFINKQLFLGDLYLWNNDYLNAAIAYKTTMESEDYLNTSARYDRYKLNWTAYQAGFARYYEYDYSSRYNSWILMFSEGQTTNFYNEWLWVMHYHRSYGEINPFIDLFLMQNGSYKLKPSQAVIDDWKSQRFFNGFYGDFRGEDGSYIMQGNEPVIMKFTYNYNSMTPFNKDGKWFLARTAGLHLRYAEAANRFGHTKIAYCLLNDGIANNYRGPQSDLLAGDITNEQKTLLDFPFNFDGAMSTTSQIPYSRGTYHRTRGVRSRVALEKLPFPNSSDSLIVLENQLIEEAGLELAFEGQRWADLVRISLRRNDPSFLAERVYQKHLKAGDPDAEAIRSKLLNPENWFLPFENK